MKRFPLLLLALLLLSSTGSSRADPNASECSDPGALAAIACELDRAVGSQARAALVVAGAVESDRPTRRPEELADRIARVVAGRLGSTAKMERSRSLSAARGMAKEAGLLLYLTIRIEDGRLRVAADLYPAAWGFWDRVRMSAPGPTAHAFAERELDAEVASFLETPPLVVAERARASFRGGRILAIACGPATATAGLELFTVTRRGVRRGRLIRGRFQTSHQARWSDLSEVAGVPLRQPLAGISVVPGAIAAGITDRRNAVVLTPELRLRRHLEGQVPVTGDLCLRASAPGLAQAVDCRSGEARPTPSPFDTLDAISERRDVDTTGHPRTFSIARDPRTGHARLTLHGPPPRSVELSGVGAQLAVTDLDLDGEIEVLTTEDTLTRQDDALTIRSWNGQTLEVRGRIPVPTGIDALAVCPPAGTSPPSIVVATQSAIVIFG